MRKLTRLIEKWGTDRLFPISLESAPHRPCGYLHCVISLAWIFLWAGLGYLCQPGVWEYTPLVSILNEESPLVSQVHRLTLDTLLQDAKLPPTTKTGKFDFPPVKPQTANADAISTIRQVYDELTNEGVKPSFLSTSFCTWKHELNRFHLPGCIMKQHFSLLWAYCLWGATFCLKLTQTPKVLFISSIFTGRISELGEDLGYNYTFFNGLNYKYPPGEFQNAPGRAQKTISQLKLLWTLDRSPRRVAGARDSFLNDLYWPEDEMCKDTVTFQTFPKCH